MFANRIDTTILILDQANDLGKLRIDFTGPFSQTADLERREKIVIDFISKNPGVTKQQVVNALDGKLSRATVFLAIKSLNESETIKIEKEKPNSQVHKLFFNEENLLTHIIARLDVFEYSFSKFVVKFNAYVKKREQLRLTAIEKAEIDTMTHFVYSIFMEFINSWSLVATVIWPLLNMNRYLRSRLYLVLFSRFGRMQLGLLDALPKVATNPELDRIADRSNTTSETISEIIIKIARNCGVDNELKDIMYEINEVEKDFVEGGEKINKYTDPTFNLMRGPIEALRSLAYKAKTSNLSWKEILEGK